MWRLSELNFRFELLALNKRAGPAGRNEFGCEQAVHDALQLQSLQAVDIVTSTEGIRSGHWQSHLPSLLRLATLMREWSGDKPLLLVQDIPLGEYNELNTGVLEDAVARFYTDTFFVFFGRAAIIPTRLTWVVPHASHPSSWTPPLICAFVHLWSKSQGKIDNHVIF